MSARATRHTSRLLTGDEVAEVLRSLPEIFKKLCGDCTVTATYGFNCNLHMDLLFLPMGVHTNWMARFIEDSIRQDIIRPGDTEFYFAAPDKAFEITFCHESDLHIAGTDTAMIRRLLAEPSLVSLNFRESPAK